MKYIVVLAFLIFSVISIAAEEKSSSDCRFDFDKKTAKVFWVGYKTKKKKPVRGIFKKVELKQSKNIVARPKDLLLGASATIDALSVYSKNKPRDVKIAKFFFGTMKSPEIFAKFERPKGGSHNGEVKMFLRMNGIEESIMMKYEVTKNILKVHGSVDFVEHFGMKKGHKGISKACSAKHKGVTGTDAAFGIEIKFKKVCSE